MVDKDQDFPRVENMFKTGRCEAYGNALDTCSLATQDSITAKTGMMGWTLIASRALAY